MDRGRRSFHVDLAYDAENSPGAPIFLACASTGCKLVFRLLEDPAAAEKYMAQAFVGRRIDVGVGEQA